MNMYRVLCDRTGTNDARELAQRLVEWHDAMVKHLRLIGSRTTEACTDDCPHTDARVLWAAARDILGASARQFGFLRFHGERRQASTRPVAWDPAAEMGA